MVHPVKQHSNHLSLGKLTQLVTPTNPSQSTKGSWHMTRHHQPWSSKIQPRYATGLSTLGFIHFLPSISTQPLNGLSTWDVDSRTGYDSHCAGSCDHTTCQGSEIYLLVTNQFTNRLQSESLSAWSASIWRTFLADHSALIVMAVIILLSYIVRSLILMISSQKKMD